MLTKPLMRNPAGKLMRDTTTGRLMRTTPYGVDCEYCDPGKTPKFITLSISGLSDCIACFEALVNEYYKVAGVAAVLNDCVVILEQTVTPCIWEKRYTDGDFGTLTYYGGANCTGIPYEYAIDILDFRVTKCAASGLLISIATRASVIAAWWMQAFAYDDWLVGPPPAPWQCKTADITDCIAVSNLANTWSCSDVQYIGGMNCCESGLVSIVEGEGTHSAPPSVQYQRRLPTGDSAVQWSRSTGSNNYSLTDDQYDSPDDDSTYTYTNVQTNKDLFSFIPFAIPAGSVITSVKVVGRFKRTEAGGDYLIRSLLKVNGVTYEGSMQQLLVGSYFDKEHVWSVNPNTGLAWTLDDVNGIGSNPLQTFGYECIGFQKTVRCTQVYVKVDYEYIW